MRYLFFAMLFVACGSSGASKSAPCTQITDTACCKNGALEWGACMREGVLTCPKGGVACNTMGWTSSQCAWMCPAAFPKADAGSADGEAAGADQ